MSVADFEGLVAWQPRRTRRFGVPLRYAGVLAVWLMLLVLNPPLAWEIFRNRRPDSPIPRLGRSFSSGRVRRI